MPLHLDSKNSARFAIFISLSLAAAPALADQVKFQTEGFACNLRIGTEEKGRIAPERPLTLNLPRRVEYLVQCESHETPVKLYARAFLAPTGPTRNSPLQQNLVLRPVAVLPNLVQASAAPGMKVVAATNVASIGCKLSAGRSFGLAEGTVVPQTTTRNIPEGTTVRLTGADPVNCGGTNLIEVQGPGWRAWFPNKAFTFSFQGRRIDIFPPSQDYTCCWIS